MKQANEVTEAYQTQGNIIAFIKDMKTGKKEIEKALRQNIKKDMRTQSTILKSQVRANENVNLRNYLKNYERQHFES